MNRSECGGPSWCEHCTRGPDGVLKHLSLPARVGPEHLPAVWRVQDGDGTPRLLVAFADNKSEVLDLPTAAGLGAVLTMLAGKQ